MTKKSKKLDVLIISLFLLLFSFVLTPLLQIKAVGKTGSIQIIFKGRTDSKDEIMLSGAKFSLYPVQYMKNAEMVWSDDFRNSGISLKEDGAGAREQQAKALSDYAVKNGIPATVQVTDISGKTCFSGLNEGIYLLVQTETAVSGTDKFESAPFLVSIPSEIDNETEYDITVEPKFEWKKDDAPEKSENTPVETGKGADTNDRSRTSSWICIIVICLVAVSVLYTKNRAD